MSRAALPKQLIPFIGGKSLLQLAYDRLEGLVPASRRYVCASRQHAAAIGGTLAGFSPDRFLGEPAGRDTLHAAGYGAAVIAQLDPEAIIAVFTADHLIEPVAKFRRIVTRGFRLVEQQPETLVTFGITPTGAATSYGYLQLGDSIGDSARIVTRFKEKPAAAVARRYFKAGARRYLWNSGMFVWRASTLLDCIRRYQPASYQGLSQIGAAWPTARRESVVNRVFPALRKISVDYAVMEPASRDPQVRVAAVPMPVKWIDVGSWPMFGETCPRDAHGNALGTERRLLLDTRGTLIASSDPRHLIAAIGCENLIIIHTPDATLVCRKDDAESLKELHRLLGERYGDSVL